MTPQQPHKTHSIVEEYKNLAQKIDNVKREYWSLNDETIESYLIGKDKGVEDLVNSVVIDYVEKLNMIQISVESIYSNLNKSGIKCQKAFMKINGHEFNIIIAIDHQDFHNQRKKKMAYKITQEEINRVDNKDVLVTYIITCSEDLNSEILALNGYNATFK